MFDNLRNRVRSLFGGRARTASSFNNSYRAILEETARTQPEEVRDTLERLKRYVEKARGSEITRCSTAVAMREVEIAWWREPLKYFSEKELPIFLMAFQCYILCLFEHLLEGRLQENEIQEITRSIRESFATLDYHVRPTFDKMLPLMRQNMPVALGQHGSATPLPIIIMSATLAGFPLPQIFDLEILFGSTLTIKRIQDFLNDLLEK
jgi:hypothetical protein